MSGPIVNHQTFYSKLESAGHKLIRDKAGNVDFFRLDYDYHNGPECELCGETWCEHCPNKIIKKCIGKTAEGGGK